MQWPWREAGEAACKLAWLSVKTRQLPLQDGLARHTAGGTSDGGPDGRASRNAGLALVVAPSLEESLVSMAVVTAGGHTSDERRGGGCHCSGLHDEPLRADTGIKVGIMI